MRLATFNVENLFRRPVVLDQPTWADGREQLNDYTKFNGIISKASYSGADKQWLVDFLDRYEMADRRIGKDDPFQLNEVRGKLFKVPKGQTKAEIIVDGRGDWDGWLELRRHNVNHVAIENTARVVEVLSADVLAVVEAEDRIALQRFNDNYLVPRGVGFLYNMLIDGNDERGIDVGLYSKHPIRSIHSNIGLGLPGERTFSRDCAEFEIETPGGDTIWVLVNHFKSKGFGSASSSNARRERQAKAVAEIYRNRVAHNPKVAVVGDLNDTPDSTPLAPLIQQTDLEDVMSHPLYLSGNDRRPGTYGSGAKSNKIDYILLSPALWATVSAVGVERRGVWAPRTSRIPEIGSAVEAASDPPGGPSVAMRIGRSGRHKIEGIVMDERSRLVVRERVATPQSDYRATLEAIAVLVRRLEAAVGRQRLAGRCRPSGRDLAVHRPPQELQFHLSQRPALPAGPRGRAGARGLPGQ